MRINFSKGINHVMNYFMLSCEDATCLISKKNHEKLSFKERTQLKMHLLSCKFCQLYKKQVAIIDYQFKKLQSGTLGPTSEISSSKKKIIKQVIENQEEK